LAFGLLISFVKELDKMKFTTVTFLVTFCISLNLYADDRDHFFRMFINTPLQGVEFYQGEDASVAARFNPNAAALTSFTLGFKDLYLGASFKGKSDAPEKGDTSYTNYNFSYNIYKFNIQVYYQEFQGFYLEAPLKDDGSFYVYPNFRTKNFGANTTYYFSKDYNRGIETIDFHNLMQDLDGAKKKDSSWFIKLGYDDNKIIDAPQNDSELSQEAESDYIEMSEGEFKTFLMTFGIDFYYIISNWFIDIKFGFGPGYQLQTFTSRGEAFEKTETTSNFQIEAALGFKLGRAILSFQLQAQRIESDLQFNRGVTNSGENIGLSLSGTF
jgi:hypothetical protein